jgi:hypothetical protein
MPGISLAHPVTLSSARASSIAVSSGWMSMFFLHAFLPFRVACLNCAGAPISDVLPLAFIVGVMVAIDP